jgi:hypothetical protein
MFIVQNNQLLIQEQYMKLQNLATQCTLSNKTVFFLYSHTERTIFNCFFLCTSFLFLSLITITFSRLKYDRSNLSNILKTNLRHINETFSRLLLYMRKENMEL